MTIQGYAKRTLLIGVLLALQVSLVAGARAEAQGYRIVLTHQGAVETVRASGGEPSRCWRIALRHFRCTATYWFDRVEALENTETGEVTIVGTQRVSRRATVDVGMKGVKGAPAP